MEIYKNEELRKQIVTTGGEMVAHGKFWLFGTATYYDGTMISIEALLPIAPELASKQAA